MVGRKVDTAALKARREALYPAPTKTASRLAFCAAAGISKSYVEMIEAGTHQPSRRIARDMAAALKWPVDRLYVADEPCQDAA